MALRIWNSNRALHTVGMKCPRCEASNCSKNGHKNGKQRYICKQYRRQFVESYSRRGYSDEVKHHCLKLYVNGMGFRAIERCMGVNHNTVINWVKQAGDSLPDATPAEVIPELAQLDELQTFVGSKIQAMVVDSRRR